MVSFLTKNLTSYIAICLSISFRVNDGLRILGIFPFHMKSQFVMGEELLKALAAKGHQVDVYSHFPLEKPVPNYNDFSLLGSLPTLTNNLTYDDVITTADPIYLLEMQYETLRGPMCDLLALPHFQKLIHDPPTDPPYDLYITEFILTHCFIPFGRHLNIPVIGVQAMSLAPWQYVEFGNPVNLADEPNPLTTYTTPMSFAERLGNFFLYHRMIRLFNAHLYKQDHYYIKKYFGPEFPTATDLQKDIALIFINDDATIHGGKPYVPKVVPAAGLNVADRNETLSKEVQKWLDESTNGCILFTFGSMIRIETFPKHIIDTLYKSFKNIAPVRILLKVAKPKDLPPELPSNVLTQTWFQQGAVLKHKNTRAFVTHGGLMGTQESIYHEVPMIGIPIFFYQQFVVNTYVRKQIAIKLQLSELNEATFTDALEKILKNPVCRENVKKVSAQWKDRPVNVMDNAIFWVEYIHRHGKDALRSSAEDVPWWQTSLLDVYAFLVALALTIAFFFAKLISVMIKMVRLFMRKFNNDKLKDN